MVLVTLSWTEGMVACFTKDVTRAGRNEGKSNGKVKIKQEDIKTVEVYRLSGLDVSVPVLRLFFSLKTHN